MELPQQEKKEIGGFLAIVAQWFVTFVALIYASGFLIVFTFFKGFGINALDFVQAKYVHVGFLFFMACLAIALPLLWIIWPMRSDWPTIGAIIHRQQVFRCLKTYIGRVLFPPWPVNDPNGIHAGRPAVFSVILLLWSFILLVTFAAPHFVTFHPKLVFGDFVVPIFILFIGLVADPFKGGSLSVIQSRSLRLVRFALRLWWLFAGSAYLYIYLPVTLSGDDLLQLLRFFFGPPLALIIVTLFLLTTCSCRHSHPSNALTRIAAIQWALYSLQWTLCIVQFWLFIWTTKSEILGVSLWPIFFGDGLSLSLLQHPFTTNWIEELPFPRGGLYFVLFIFLISFLWGRTTYRLKQIEQEAHRRATVLSTAAIVLTLFYMAILSFATFIYPHIPYSKDGGDYTANHTVRINFNPQNQIESLKASPAELSSRNASNCLMVLEETSTSLFLADSNESNPESWRNWTKLPKVYEVRRDCINYIEFLTNSAMSFHAGHNHRERPSKNPTVNQAPSH
jgi:hypothetical protein